MQIISQILSLYSQMDQLVTDFQIRTGLHCPSGCGVCCSTGDVHTTVLEMLPVASEIISRDLVDLWLERIAIQDPENRCVFYSADRLPDVSGHCVYYTWRPAICRLFGFAAVRNRCGSAVLAICRQIKHSPSQAVATALAHQNEAPVFSAVTTPLYSLEPSAKIERLPINTALRKALMRVGLGLQLTAGGSAGQTVP